MPRRPRSPAPRLAGQAIELGLAVPEVIARRVARMVLAGASPTAADRDEFHRMGAEKVVAFYESWNAMFLAAYRANLRLLLSAPPWWAPWAGPWPRALRAHARRTGVDLMASGIAPIHRRAVANAKRLRK